MSQRLLKHALWVVIFVVAVIAFQLASRLV